MSTSMTLCPCAQHRGLVFLSGARKSRGRGGGASGARSQAGGGGHLDGPEVLLHDARVAVENVLPLVVLEQVEALQGLDDVLLADARHAREVADRHGRPALPQRLQEHPRPVGPVRHGAQVREGPLRRPDLVLQLRGRAERWGVARTVYRRGDGVRGRPRTRGMGGGGECDSEWTGGGKKEDGHLGERVGEGDEEAAVALALVGGQREDAGEVVLLRAMLLLAEVSHDVGALFVHLAQDVEEEVLDVEVQSLVVEKQLRER